MTYALTIATAADRDVVVDSLRAGAAQRTTVATAASAELAKFKAAGKDVRARSVKVAMLLAEAANLTALADTLAGATAVPVLAPANEVTINVDPDADTNVIEGAIIDTIAAIDQEGTTA